jgi:MOSC domain-containing protein YiiM
MTLISADGVEEAFAANAVDRESLKSIGDLRRNVVLRGISSSDLLNAVGSIIRLGEKGALVFVHRNCVPCMYNERKNRIPGMMEALWYAAGVSCEVISGGEISVGDAATIQVNDEGYVLDPGNQSKSFFVRPTERSADMVRDALEHRKRMYKQLKEIDEKGVLLLQKSYESVGLNFWPRNGT